MTAVVTTLLEAALACAAADWRVLPVGVTQASAEGKAPLLKDWVTLATSNPDTLAQWWQQWPDANVGIATGIASNLLVVDIDPRNGGLETLASLEAEGKALPDTWMVQTGGGGIHAYYYHPRGVTGNPRQPLKAKGFELKGDGGQVLAVGSINRVTGAVYTPYNSLPIVDAPAWLVALGWPPAPVLEPLPAPALVPLSPHGDKAQKWAQEALKRELASVASAGKGSRNDTLNKAAYSLGQLVGGGYLDGSDVSAQLADAGARAGLERAEIRATIASGLRAGANNPRRYEPKSYSATTPQKGHFKGNTNYIEPPQRHPQAGLFSGAQSGAQSGPQTPPQTPPQRNEENTTFSREVDKQCEKSQEGLEPKHYVVLQACWDWVTMEVIMGTMGLKATAKNIDYYRPRFVTPLVTYGYIQKERQVNTGEKKKQRYKITPSGEALLTAWLEERYTTGAVHGVRGRILPDDAHMASREKLNTSDIAALIYHLHGHRLICDTSSRDGLLYEYLEQGYWRLMTPGIVENAFITSFDPHEAVRTNRTREILSFLKIKLGEFDNQWNTLPNPWCIPFLNGVLDTSGPVPILHPHDKDHRLTSVVPCNWNPNAQAPRFRAFLKQCFEGLPDWYDCEWAIWEFLGYCLLPKPFHKKFLYLCGQPDTGKSVLAKVFQHLVGQPFTATIPLEELGNQFTGSALYNKRLCLCNEPSANSLMNDGVLKSWTGNDPQKVEFKGKQPFTWEHTVRFVVVGNTVARTDDKTDATVSRILMVPFENRIGKRDRDPFLFEALKAEMEGIAGLAVGGVCNLRENGGFTEPASGKYLLERELARRKPDYQKAHWERSE